MGDGTRVLIALSKSEYATFLPEPLLAEVRRMAPEHRIVVTDTVEPDEYVRTVLEFQPEVILSAWDAPPLREDLAGHMLPFLKYYCYLCGSVRSRVPRSYIDAGVLVTNWGDSIGPSVAEAALLLVLSALRQSTHWTLRMHVDKGWVDEAEEYDEGLFGKRLGLHGFGVIARTFADIVQPFGTALKAFSPSVPDEVFEACGVSRTESLETLFATSDVLVELAPNKPEYFHIVTEELLRLLPPRGVFVNVGRGSVVDEDALIRVAAEGKLRVGLDVYETEPLPADSPLRGMRNVTLLPHVGGPTADRKVDCGEFAVRNVQRYLSGEPLQNLITSAVYDRIT